MGETMDVRGYIRQRGEMLEAVIVVDGKKRWHATGLRVGEEAAAELALAKVLAELGQVAPAGAAPAAPGSVRAWGEQWIADRKAREKLEYIHERSHLEHFLYPVLGLQQLAGVTDVVMLDWARGLPRQVGPSGKPPGPKYVRKITATVRALFKEALRRHLIERTPCVWEDIDLPPLEANARVVGAGFELEDLQRLVYDELVREDRRVLYALEFLTGMRTGEAAARTWADWADVSYRGDLGRIVARTAYNTRHRVVKTTKTRIEKWLPVHPALAEILTAWKASGWERFMGRPPEPSDLIVPPATYSRERPQPRNNAYSWRMFRDDLKALGIAHQRHYETRSTFINLAEAGGASPEDVHRLTHASLGEAKDLYRRVPQQWPRLCKAVRAIALVPPTNGRSHAQVTLSGGGAASAACSAVNPDALEYPDNTANGGRARESNPPAAPFSTTHRF